VLYLLLGIVIAIPAGLISLVMSTRTQMGLPMLLLVFLLPIFYAVIGFVFVAIGCWIYNLVAGMVGGIRVDIRTVQ
jgi:hypothetical protein